MKEIKLTKGKVALVDDEDYEWLNQWKWSAKGNDRYTYYAVRLEKQADVKRKIVSMHRQILGLSDLEIKGDHIDGNGLNNQRSNLRAATNSQNQANRIKKQSTTSKYLGVHKYKEFWVAACRKDEIERRKWCKTEVEAALQYNIWAIELHGEFARVNIIPEEDVYNHTKNKLLQDTIKWCPCCNTIKSIEEFGKKSSTKRGVHSYCKICYNEQSRKRYRRKRATVC